MTKRRDTDDSINMGNAAMWTALNLGVELRKELGLRSDYGAMKAKTKGDESQAEKMRKYRAMATRITRSELKDISELTQLHGKALGPTHLVALSRLTKVGERRKIAKVAIREGWGLAELQRRMRRQLGPQKDATVVGRKRQIDLMSETAILEQISGLCLSWIRLNTQLQQTEDLPGKSGLSLLPQKLREQFTEASILIAKLQQRTDKRIERVTR